MIKVGGVQEDAGPAHLYLALLCSDPYKRDKSVAAPAICTGRENFQGSLSFWPLHKTPCRAKFCSLNIQLIHYILTLIASHTVLSITEL